MSDERLQRILKVSTDILFNISNLDLFRDNKRGRRRWRKEKLRDNARNFSQSKRKWSKAGFLPPPFNPHYFALLPLPLLSPPPFRKTTFSPTSLVHLPLPLGMALTGIVLTRNPPSPLPPCQPSLRPLTHPRSRSCTQANSSLMLEVHVKFYNYNEICDFINYLISFWFYLLYSSGLMTIYSFLFHLIDPSFNFWC